MKRYLIAGAVGTMVFGAALGSAAALDITGNPTVQYGEDMSLECDPDGVLVEGFTPDTEMTSGPQTSDRVRVSGINSDCYGKALVAVVTDENGNRISRGVVFPISQASHWVTYPTVDAADIDGLRLLIG